MCGQTSSSNMDECEYCETMYYNLPSVHDNIVEELFNIMSDVEHRPKPDHKRKKVKSMRSQRTRSSRKSRSAKMRDMTPYEDYRPCPMRNYRPTRRIRTGAERFECAHHGIYEARCPQSKKAIHPARINRGYPKMYDELERRHSVAKPIIPEPRKNTRVTKSQTSKFQKASRRNTLKSWGITKPKSKRKQVQCKYAMKHQSCQCQIIKLNTDGTIYNPFSDKFELSFHNDSNSTNEAEKIQELQKVCSTVVIKNENNSESEINNSKKSDEVSMSSYNTFASMDHEPMV